MARHNREGTGTDQLGNSYTISYQPDWFYQVKVSRDLESGRQSTKTLYRNLEPAEASPGHRVRTRIQCEQLGIDFEVTVDDPKITARKIVVEAMATPAEGSAFPLSFVIYRQRKIPSV